MNVNNTRRISDISFSIDKDLNIKSGNKSFSIFLHKTDFSGLNLSELISETDAENFKYFLSNFNPQVFPETENFVARIKSGEFFISCIFTVQKVGEEIFGITAEELSYSRELLDRALLESREYATLLKNFDAYYFIYEKEKFCVKNTKDLNTLFIGSAEDFAEYFKTLFHLNRDSTLVKKQLETMLSNVESFKTGRSYNFLKKDKKMLTVHTLRASTRKKTIVVGSIKDGLKFAPSENAYAESHDGLTGLYNKTAITEIAEKKINEQKVPCSVIVIDVDKFKECNDTFGHIFGDRVLSSVASCIKDAIGTKGIAGRIGGDEFLVLLDLVEEEDIRNIARNIRIGIQWNITAIEPRSMVTCSMGVARFPLNEKKFDRVFKLADKCLYIAKNKGRNCYIIYKPELHDIVFTKNRENENKLATGQLYNDAAEAEYEIVTAIQNIKKGDDIKPVLEMLAEYLGLNSITIYGKDLKLFCATGDKNQNFREEALKKADYFSFFNHFGYLHLDNTNVLDSTAQEKFSLYTNNSIGSTLEVLCGEGKEKVLFCFDVFKPARTFPKEKITFMLMISRMIYKQSL